MKNKLQYNKKGSNFFDKLGLIGFGILSLMFVLVILFLMNAKIQDNTLPGLIDSASATNESVTWTNGTVAATAFTPLAFELSCNAVYNDSANTFLITSGNYTCSRAGVLYTDNDGVRTGSTIWVNYTYKLKDHAYNATEQLSTDAYSIVTWVALIITVMIGVLLLLLVAAIKKAQ